MRRKVVSPRLVKLDNYDEDYYYYSPKTLQSHWKHKLRLFTVLRPWAAHYRRTHIIVLCVSLLLNPTFSWIMVPTILDTTRKRRRTTWNHHYHLNHGETKLWLGPKRASREQRNGDMKNHTIDATTPSINMNEQVDEMTDPSWKSNAVSAFSIDTDNLLGNASSSTMTIPLADVRSLSSNVSYFYLQNELGLSEDVMWKITYDAGSVLGMTAHNIRRKVQVLRDLMGLSDEDLRTIIQRQPSVLQLSADKNISPTILNLLRSLDLGRDELKRLIVSFPGILTYSNANIRAKIRFFTHILGFSTDQCRKIFLKEPMLFRVGVDTGLFPRMRFLLQDVQISQDDLRRIILRHPRILMYSLENNLVPKLVFYCLLTIRLETRQVSRLLLTYPEFMGYNLDRTILPITRYFLQDLDFSLPEFQKILLSYPRLMSNSLTKIKHVVGYLRYETDLCAAQVRRVLYQAPAILGLATDTSVRNKVTFLRDTLELDDDDDWKRLLTGIPNVLLLSIDGNLKPKLSYLLQAFDNDLDSLREAVLRLPTLLGYSLEKRLVPRMQAIQNAGVDPSSITIGIPMKEERFQEWLQGRIDKLEKEAAAAAAAASKDEGPGDVDESTKDTAEAQGRIIHWTRERRRRKR